MNTNNGTEGGAAFASSMNGGSDAYPMFGQSNGGEAYPMFLWDNISAVRGTLGFSSIDHDAGETSAGDPKGQPTTDLLNLVQSYDWDGALKRLVTHPEEAVAVGVEGRRPLHVACDQDAPPAVIRALLAAHPEASTMVGTSDMNPLHITCSSQRASVNVVRVLLECGRKEVVTSMRDIDGDTPLHAACRCAAPIEVLKELLDANPNTVHMRDFEGLTPLLRLWVRYIVTLGDGVIDAVRGPEDLVGELAEAWEKTLLLLVVAYHGSLNGEHEAPAPGEEESKVKSLPREFSALHALAAVDCPRAIVKIAAKLYSSKLVEKDENGRLPLTIAASAPTYKDHDLSDEGYCIEDQILGDDANLDGLVEDDFDHDGVANSSSKQEQTSVIEILVEACPKAASVRDRSGRLPLHLALEAGKTWTGGVKALLDAYPEATMHCDATTRLFPFMLASSPATKKSDISTMFEILRADPEQVMPGIEKRCCKEEEEKKGQ